MPHNYLDTPATEREDISLAQVPSLDFSIVQPFASPSKNPAEDLRNKMRGLRNGGMQQPPVRTPRVRNALLDRRNTTAVPAKQEFTPLLKSAKRKELVRRSIFEEKENVLSSGIPDTPAAFRSSYIGNDTQLPLHSSMIDSTNISGSMVIESVARVENPVSSSMLSATPLPSLPDRGGVVLDQGNVLTLRDQEAKLDQIQKDNFGLKLKIHYLEEALRKTGSEFHQATLKENAELKTERATVEIDLRRLRKRLEVLERELEVQRQRCTELQSKNADQHLARELAEAQRLAEARLKMADDRLQEIEDLQQRLREAEEEREPTGDLQALKDDIEDLKRDVRHRDEQIDAKDDELDALKEKLEQDSGSPAELEHMQQDIDDLEAELKERDEELDVKNARLAELEDRVNNIGDREKSTQKLRADVVDLEADLRQKSHDLDDAMEQLNALRKQLGTNGAEHDADLARRDEEIVELTAQLKAADVMQATCRGNEDALRNLQREVADKDGEIRALQERLETARGSWDAEAQQTDARLQEKDRQIRERDTRLREKVTALEQRDNELSDLQRRLRLAELHQGEATQSQTDKTRSLNEQVRDLEQSMRSIEHTHQARIFEKDNLLQAREAELKSLQNRLSSAQQADSATLLARNEMVQQLEAANRRLEKQSQDHLSHIASLERRADAIETPSRKDALIKEYSNQVRSLREEMRKIEQDKDVELDGLEQELDRVDKEKKRLQEQASAASDLQRKLDEMVDDKLDLQRRFDRMSDKAKSLDRDQSTELGGQKAKISLLESEVDALQAKCSQHETKLRSELEALRQRLARDHDTVRQSFEDEIMVLEVSLEEADTNRKSQATRVQDLQDQLESLQLARSQETPAKQRRELRANLASIEGERDELAAKIDQLEQDLSVAHGQKSDSILVKEHATLTESLQTAQAQMQDMQRQITILEQELESAREEKTIADERQDLHDLVKSAKIEAEKLQIKLAAHSKRENDLRKEKEAAELAADDLQAGVIELEEELRKQAKREANLKAQLSSLRNARPGLGDREAFTDGHDRTGLREVRAKLESVQNKLADRDDRIVGLMKREQSMRESLKQARMTGDDTINDHLDDLKTQLVHAQRNVHTLRMQLVGRGKMHGASQQAIGMDECITFNQPQSEIPANAMQLRHKQELKGMAKQIKFLQARCAREERLRQDLVYVKRWFLLQVEMFNECNQADLRLLEEIGITPDQTIRDSKPSLRAAGLAVIALNRMRKLSEDWSVKRRCQEALVSKLESMKRAKARSHR